MERVAEGGGDVPCGWPLSGGTERTDQGAQTKAGREGTDQGTDQGREGSGGHARESTIVAEGAPGRARTVVDVVVGHRDAFKAEGDAVNMRRCGAVPQVGVRHASAHHSLDAVGLDLRRGSGRGPAMRAGLVG